VRKPLSRCDKLQPMPTKKTPKPDPNVNDYAVGDHIKVNMHRGRIVEAVIKACR
jgi:hypothetical protein